MKYLRQHEKQLLHKLEAEFLIGKLLKILPQ